eukprot:COSAG06_NODE_1080_length_10790_cov_7.338228_9_plen_50_part_00
MTTQAAVELLHDRMRSGQPLVLVLAVVTVGFGGAWATVRQLELVGWMAF